MRADDRLLDGMEVLVVDDESYGRAIVSGLLRDFGCRDVVQARNGAEALSILRSGTHLISLVIADFNMPLINGLSLLKEIRRSTHPAMPHDVPVFMLTGHSEHHIVGVALALDVDSFIVKPTSRASLAARIRKVLRAGDRRRLLPPDSYRSVDVDRAVVTMAERGIRAGTGEIIGRSVVVALADVPPNSILAEDIAGGESVLLRRGQVVTPHILDRLAEVAPMLGLSTIAIRS